MSGKTALKMYFWTTVLATGLFIILLGSAAFQVDPTQWSPVASRMNVFCNDPMTAVSAPGYSECLDPETLLVIGPAGELLLHLLMWMWGGLAFLGFLWLLLAGLTILSDSEDEVADDIAY